MYSISLSVWVSEFFLFLFLCLSFAKWFKLCNSIRAAPGFDTCSNLVTQLQIEWRYLYWSYIGAANIQDMHLYYDFFFHQLGRNPSAKYTKFSEHARSLISGEKQCALFCGGKKCKYCKSDNWTLEQTAIEGLYSNW